MSYCFSDSSRLVEHSDVEIILNISHWANEVSMQSNLTPRSIKICWSKLRYKNHLTWWERHYWRVKHIKFICGTVFLICGDLFNSLMSRFLWHFFIGPAKTRCYQTLPQESFKNCLSKLFENNHLTWYGRHYWWVKHIRFTLNTVFMIRRDFLNSVISRL